MPFYIRLLLFIFFGGSNSRRLFTLTLLGERMLHISYSCLINDLSLIYLHIYFRGTFQATLSVVCDKSTKITFVVIVLVVATFWRDFAYFSLYEFLLLLYLARRPCFCFHISVQLNFHAHIQAHHMQTNSLYRIKYILAANVV